MPEEFLKNGYYFEIYQKIFKFHKDNASPSDEDWGDVIDQLGLFKTEFERDLCYAVVSEIERQYKRR